MKNEQLNILLQHGDILFRQNYPPIESLYFIKIGDKIFNLSIDTGNTIECLFYNYLNEFTEVHSKMIFYEKIKNDLDLYSTLGEDKIQRLNQHIKGEKEKLDKLNMEYFKNNCNISDIDFPITAFDVTFPSGFVGPSFLSEPFIETLKFDIFKGQKIEKTGLKNYGFKCFGKLEFFDNFSEHKGTERINKFTCKDLRIGDFFKTTDVTLFFKIVAITENINYLKKIIENLESSKKKGSKTYRVTAIAEMYKRDAGYVDELQPKDVVKQYGARAKQDFYSVLYWFSKSKSVKPIRIDELENALDLLADYPNARKKALNVLENLQNS